MKGKKLLAALPLAILIIGSNTTTADELPSYEPISQEEFTYIERVPSPTDLPIIVDNLGQPPSPKPRPTTIIGVDPEAQVVVKSTPRPKAIPVSRWLFDREVSWYGPGFYGNRTACGLAYTKTILGVAHRSLPCGTKVAFRWKGREIIVPVIDRGPYVAGRQWDLSGGLCVYLDHCFTGPIEYYIVR